MSLPYAAPPQLRRLTIFRRVALWCALLPMTSGVVVFLIWLLTEKDFLQILGFLTILAGCGLFVVGGICLLIYAWREFSGHFASPKAIFRKVLFPAALLVLNFPLAFAIVAVVEYVQHRIAIKVTNVGTLPVTSFVIIADDFEKEFGPVQPKQSVRFKHHADSFAPVKYKLVQNGLTKNGTLQLDYSSHHKESRKLNGTIDDGGVVEKDD